MSYLPVDVVEVEIKDARIFGALLCLAVRLCLDGFVLGPVSDGKRWEFLLDVFH
jgi:hypothetical protein